MTGVDLGVELVAAEKEILTKIKNLCSTRELKAPHFSVEDSATVVSQSKISTMSFGNSTSSYMGKISYPGTDDRSDRKKRMKQGSPCKSCGIRGHWWNYN